jgi:hypothetical protein
METIDVQIHRIAHARIPRHRETLTQYEHLRNNAKPTINPEIL